MLVYGDAMTKLYEKTIDDLENNSVVIFGDVSGVRLVGKIRGLNPVEIGILFGKIQASLEVKIGSLRDHIRAKGGPQSADEFDKAFVFGKSQRLDGDGQFIIER